MIRKNLKIGMKAVAAMLVAFLLVNGICFYYYSMPGWLYRSGNATRVIDNPYSTLRQHMEGGGALHVDGAGYLNPDLPLKESGYVLALGASHTAGKEMKEEERYTSLLNEMLGDGDSLTVYNMGTDGHYYPRLVNGFHAAIQEFPHSSAVILEIGTTSYWRSELKSCLNQREFDERQLGAALVADQSPAQRLRFLLKEKLPFLTLLKNKQFVGWGLDFSTAFGLRQAAAPAAEKSSDITDMEEYFEAINKTMRLMRGQYDGKIIIIYHPEATLEEDGSISFADEAETTAAFQRASEENNISFVNVQDAFQKAYDEKREVPYGFENTAFGEGHLNRYGHRILAQALYPLLKEGE